MVITICHCAWDIPGVDELPAHHHVFTNELKPSGNYFERGPLAGQPIMAMVADPYRIFFHVDWKAVVRSL